MLGPPQSMSTSEAQSSSVSSIESPRLPIRLCGVIGFEGRTNDIIYCHPLIKPQPFLPTSAVVFFGGDIQDLPENMDSHREYKVYAKWNLENTATLLHTQFPDSHILVVRPSRMEFHTFSCFDNFVPGNNCGSPDHTPTHQALQHLERLFHSTASRLKTLYENVIPSSSSSDDEQKESSYDETIDSSTSSNTSQHSSPEYYLGEHKNWWEDVLSLEKAHIRLVGFSKGCVVLNQFLYEFHYLKTLTPDDATMMGLVHRIKEMFWLDGGHAGGKNTWITSRALLETLTRLGIRVHIHVTPYQIEDDRRPWIRKEEKTFTELLRQLGASLVHTIHFENQPSSLMAHFELIAAFRSPIINQSKKV